MNTLATVSVVVMALAAFGSAIVGKQDAVLNVAAELSRAESGMEVEANS